MTERNTQCATAVEMNRDEFLAIHEGRILVFWVEVRPGHGRGIEMPLKSILECAFPSANDTCLVDIDCGRNCIYMGVW